MNDPLTSVTKFRWLLSGLCVDEPLHHKSLTLFPLSWLDTQGSPYTLLQQAIETNEAAVEEVTEAGSVPNLLLSNKGDRPVLILEGDILKGAKQNRVVNVTVLVAAHSKFTLPVSCVEQGRWRYTSKHFATCACAPPSLRSKKTKSVQRNRREQGVAMSDQGEVWDEVAKGLNDLRASSPTSSLIDGFEAAKGRLDEYRRALKLPENAAGILAVNGQRVLGMDLFDSPKTLSSLWHRLGDAYFLDAIRDDKEKPPAGREIAQDFLARIAERARPRVPALGLGDELEIVGAGVVGAALLYADKICHLAAFTDVE